jgi:hypothetical protein
VTDETNHPSAEPFPNETIRVWCCQTPVNAEHDPGCTFQPIPGQEYLVDDNGPILRDFRNAVNIAGWDARLNISDRFLAEYLLAQLTNLARTIGNANLTPSPRDIPFGRYSGYQPPPAGQGIRAVIPPSVGRPMLGGPRTYGIARSEAPVTAEAYAGIEPSAMLRCACGQVEMIPGGKVRVVDGTRHRLFDPCYGIGVSPSTPPFPLHNGNSTPCSCGHVLIPDDDTRRVTPTGNVHTLDGCITSGGTE